MAQRSLTSMQCHPHPGLTPSLLSLPSGHEVMTVSPLYGQQHSDVRYTGIMAPVRLPSGPPSQQQAAAVGHARGPMGFPQDAPTPSCSSVAQTLSLRQRGLLDRLQRGSLRHRTARVVRSLRAGSGTGSQEGGGGGSGEYVSFVRFFAVHRDGVDHVFVEHPLFQTHASQLTYSEGGRGVEHGMLAQARCSVLCQAALAAPTLLWLAEDGASWREALAGQQGQGVAWGVQHGLGRPAGDYTLASSSLQSLLSRVGLQGGHPLSLWPARQLLSHHAGAQQQQQQPEGADNLEESSSDLDLQVVEDAPVVFVANDWPAGLLPLWLDAYLDVRDEERRGSNTGSSSSSSTSGSGGGSGGSSRALPINHRERPRLSLTGPSAKQPIEVQSLESSDLVNHGRGSGPGRPSHTGSSSGSSGSVSELMNHGRGSGPGRPSHTGSSSRTRTRSGSGPSTSAGGRAISVNNGLGSGPGRPAAETSSDAGARPAGGDDNGDAAQLQSRPGGVSGDARSSGSNAAGSAANMQPSPSSFLRFGSSSTKKGTRDHSSQQEAGGSGAAAAALPYALSSTPVDQKDIADQGTSAASPLTTAPSFSLTSSTAGPPAQPGGANTVSARRTSRLRRKARPASAEQQPRSPPEARPASGRQPRGPPEDAGSSRALQSRGPPEDAGSSRALLMALAAFQQLVLSKLHDARFVLAIHNFGFHGLFDADTFPRLGLPPRQLPLLLTQRGGEGEAVAQRQGTVEEQSPPPLPQSLARPQISWMQAALLASDHVVTVSPQHARELQTAAAEVLRHCDDAASSDGALALTAAGGPRPSLSMATSLLQPGRHGSTSSSDHTPHLLGILNGIDTALWDPAHDVYLPSSVRYGAESVAEGKARAKHLLQVRGLAAIRSVTGVIVSSIIW